MAEILPFLIGLIAGLVVAGLPFAARVRRLRTEVRLKDAALAAAREVVRKLQDEAEAARLRPAEVSVEILADNADLRRRIDEVTDALMAQAGQGASRSVPPPPASVAAADPSL